MTDNPYPQPYSPEHKAWAIAWRNGVNAASWAFDGNTSRETYQRFLDGIEDGDPMVLDSVRTPSLSGEYSDDYSEEDLMSDVGWVPNDGTDLRDDLAQIYIETVSEAFWYEIERMARYQLGA